MLFMRGCPPVWPDTHRSFHGSDFLEVGIHDTVIVGLLLVVGSTCVGAGLCACSLLCGSSCLVHLLEHLAQSFLLCLDVVDGAGLHGSLEVGQLCLGIALDVCGQLVAVLLQRNV